MKKLAIIGRGTAGSLAAAHFLRYTDWEIDWYFDNDIKPQAVGEGATLNFPIGLRNCLNFKHCDLSKIDGTFKSSIYKEGWGKGQSFHHSFPPPAMSYHFNANKLQDYILSIVRNNNRLVIKEQNILQDEIDSDFILNCSGRPQSYDEYNLSEYISVNAVYVNQCYWDYPRFQYTLTIARPYGWVFAIPLQNRCSVGYMYNNNINTIEEVKEDIKEIFKQYNLIPSESTNSFSFKNYYRKQNFNNRIAYNGNASFFLEPLEATSIATMQKINIYSLKLWNSNIDNERANYIYTTQLKETESMIMLHYFAGSIYDTDFWRHAKNAGTKCILKSLTQKKYKLNKSFYEIILDSYRENIHDSELEDFGTWSVYSFKENILGLNLKEKLDKLIDNLQL